MERSRKEKGARSSETKTTHQVGTWKYPRARVFLEKCTTLSTEFTKKVETAFAASDSFAALQDVFNEYGHVVPKTVILGGLLSCAAKRESQGSEEDHAYEDQLKAAVEAKLGKASGSAGLAVANATETKTGDVALIEVTDFAAHGGDALLCLHTAGRMGPANGSRRQPVGWRWRCGNAAMVREAP